MNMRLCINYILT